MSGMKNKIKGTLKQVEGKLTGDKVRTAQGTFEKAKGNIQATAARTARSAKQAVRRAGNRSKA